MSLGSYFAYLLVMAGVAYLVRAIPFLAIRKKIQNRFINSFMFSIIFIIIFISFIINSVFWVFPLHFVIRYPVFISM